MEQRQIGIVKWAHDKALGKDYGFISHQPLGDIYFNAKGLKSDQNFSDFKENSIVTFVVETSVENKHRAKSVCLLKDESDLNFLGQHCFSIYIGNSSFDEDLKKMLISSVFASFGRSIALYDVITSLIPPDLPHDSRYELIKSLIIQAKDLIKDKFDIVLANLISHCNSYVRLLLWIDNLYNELNYHECKNYIIGLSNEKQKVFLKKCFYSIKTEAFNVSVQDIFSLQTVDYELAKTVESLTTEKLDYSIAVVLYALEKLNETKNLPDSALKSLFREQKIFEIILSKIKEPTDILTLDGFFDMCRGRTVISNVREEIVEGEKKKLFNRYHLKDDKPFALCEGRLALSDKTNEPVLCERSDLQFWWCANKRCYQSNVFLKDDNEWEGYTFYDFLSILGLNDRRQDVEFFHALVNKINKFLTHMKCRECQEILYPKGESNYAFYRVNKFECKKESCSEKFKEIYITHCINGRCQAVIDSRDSVRCRGFKENKPFGGWYICHDCLACCSTEALERRKIIRTTVEQDIKNTLHSHQNEGEICCDKCGNALTMKTKSDNEDYAKYLDWFLKNKDNKTYISKCGYNEKYGNWFLFNQERFSVQEYHIKLEKLNAAGFIIKDFHDKNKKSYLVNERVTNNSIWECVDCKIQIDFAALDENRFGKIAPYHKKHSFFK